MFTLGSLPFGSVTQTIAGSAKPQDVIAGGYTMIPQKFYHPNPSRNALGLVGGNEVSMATGNLVDVESDLRNITRDLTDCPSKKYQPSCPLGAAGSAPAAANSLASFTGGPCAPWPSQIVFQERGTSNVRAVNTQPRHLATTQYVSYPGVPAPESFKQEVYGYPWRF
jgi:hypothetical protein